MKLETLKSAGLSVLAASLLATLPMSVSANNGKGAEKSSACEQRAADRAMTPAQSKSFLAACNAAEESSSDGGDSSSSDGGSLGGGGSLDGGGSLL